jgi:cell pole-organizing protein PopZ
MGDLSAEPSMEDILSSIKRIIAEEGEGNAAPVRSRRAVRPADPAPAVADDEPSDDDGILELSDPVPTPKGNASSATAPQPAVPPRTAESILSSKTAEASRGALEALSRMIVKPDTPGADTLQGLVQEMLRPMLREWLDAHLPEMVEQMVAREISRITGQAS